MARCAIKVKVVILVTVLTILIFSAFIHWRNQTIDSVSSFGNIGTLLVSSSLFQRSNIAALIPHSEGQATSHVLHHPKSPKQLWVQIDNRFIIRRLAYLDTRDDTPNLTFLSMYDYRQLDPPEPIFVKLYYYNTPPSGCLVTQSVPAFLRGKDVYVSYLITLKVPQAKGYNVSHATISTWSDCSIESNKVSLQYTSIEQGPRYTYGVCLHKALLSNVKPQVLLDWVKLNIALGAEVITVYLQSVPESLYTVLKPYINKGIVDVLDWKLEPPLTSTHSFHSGQTGVIDECIWYNMNRVKYLGLYDLDEFIVPLKHNNIQEMITEIVTTNKKASKSASWLFWNANMYNNGTPLSSVRHAKCPRLTSRILPVYFRRSQSCVVLKEFLRKMIVQPLAVSASWGHELLIYREKEYNKDYVVPSEMGQSFHYRPNWKGFHGCSSIKKDQPVLNRYFTNITGCAQ